LSEQKPFTDRDIRQRDIVSPEKLKKLVAAVIGVGAVGHQVARQLASMGVGRIILIDPDTVGVENLAAQGFREEDIGNPKTSVVAMECVGLNSEIIIEERPMKFRKGQIMDLELDEDLVVFACVDDMAARKQIAKAVSKSAWLFLDGRMAAEVFSVYSACNKADRDHYESTLFSNDEMFQASCTAKTTLYCANIIAGMMVAQMTKYMRGIPLDRELHFNVLMGTIRYAENEQAVEA
jgi:sulfur carrier protein ThiS adenylyltransferase